MKKRYLLLIVMVLVLWACNLGSALQPKVEATPGEAIEQMPVPAETQTPAPADSLAPSATSLPPDTPAITPTSGPVLIKDDFSTRNDPVWPDCETCKWKDGQLLLGPYDPGSNPNQSLNYLICQGCGEHEYYRVSVDATFVDGQADRYFGVMVRMQNNRDNIAQRLNYLGITPLQAYVVRDYNNEILDVDNLARKNAAGAVKPGRATNHFEMIVQPGSQAGSTDIYFRLNDTLIYIYYTQNTLPTSVGLGMSGSSVTVAYDNFEYEELVP